MKEKLFGRKNVPVTHVHVETNNGIVYLSGTVENREQAIDAAQLARSIPEVTNVISRIEVTNSAQTQAQL